MLNQTTLDTRSHAFNVGIAIDYNPTMALWLAHLAFWAEKNLANQTHIYDGYVWCYDTLDAICEYFPYFTRRQIETMINNSVESGLVIKGNYNQTQYDRTCWYALTPKAFAYFTNLSSKKNIERLYSSISHICEMDITEWGNRFTHFVTTIPDTTPDTDPDTVKPLVDSANTTDYTKDDLFMLFYNTYPNKQKPKEAHKAFKKLKPTEKFTEMLVCDYRTRLANNWKGRHKNKIPHPATYLNSREWEGEIVAPEAPKIGGAKAKYKTMDEILGSVNGHEGFL